MVDGSDKRRNRDTANAVWGNATSVLVGDFLYSRAFEMMVDINMMRVMEILSHATNRIAEGEVLQLLNCNDADIDEQKYFEVILRKTATLFEAGAQLGAVLCGAGAEQEQALADYGRHLGIAFQIIDDALDYSSSDNEIGKNIGDDLAEGKPTLPLLRAMQVGTDTQRQALRDAIEQGGRERIDVVMDAIESTDAIEYTSRLAKEEAAKAKAALERASRLSLPRCAGGRGGLCRKAQKLKLIRGVAQPGSALRSGRRSRRFESSHPDQHHAFRRI